MSPVRGEPLEEERGRDDPKEPVVLLVEDGVSPEGLRHVLVEVGREGKVRVQVKNQAPVVRPVDEEDVIVPYDQLLLVFAGLLLPERNHLLLVGHENHVTLWQFCRGGPSHVVADLPDVLLAEARSVGAVGSGGDQAGDVLALGSRGRRML